MRLRVSKNENRLKSSEERSEDEMKDVYSEYRRSFLNYAKQYYVEKEDLLDLFQDAVIAFYEQKERGKLKDLKCSEKTYLFNIGRHKVIDFLKKHSKMRSMDNVVYEVKIEPSVYQRMELTEQQEGLTMAIKLLGDSCQEIIEMFYYKKYSIDAIMTALNFKSENVVKANKSRCLKSLRQILKNQSKEI